MGPNLFQMTTTTIGLLISFFMGHVFQQVEVARTEIEVFRQFKPEESALMYLSCGLSASPSYVFPNFEEPPVSIVLSFPNRSVELSAAIDRIAEEPVVQAHYATRVRLPSGREGTYNWMQNELVIESPQSTPIDKALFWARYTFENFRSHEPTFESILHN